MVLAVLSAWKKLRGIFAGMAFVAACASLLYEGFTTVFSIPSAASNGASRMTAEVMQGA